MTGIAAEGARVDKRMEGGQGPAAQRKQKQKQEHASRSPCPPRVSTRGVTHPDIHLGLAPSRTQNTEESHVSFQIVHCKLPDNSSDFRGFIQGKLCESENQQSGILCVQVIVSGVVAEARVARRRVGWRSGGTSLRELEV